jgi:tetratricopeptide (TPR) repeat protein
MKTLNVTFILVLSTILFSCQVKQTNTKKLEIEKITKLEKQVFDTVNFQLRKPVADNLIKLYGKFAENYQTDSLTPIYLFKKADLLAQMKQFNKSIKIYDKIYKNYPDFNQRAEALFLEATLYDNVLKNTTMAAVKYKEFIKEFPNHELRDDAEKSLMFLGKTPEEIIKILQQTADSLKQDSVKHN